MRCLICVDTYFKVDSGFVVLVIGGRNVVGPPLRANELVNFTYIDSGESKKTKKKEN